MRYTFKKIIKWKIFVRILGSLCVILLFNACDNFSKKRLKCNIVQEFPHSTDSLSEILLDTTISNNHIVYMLKYKHDNGSVWLHIQHNSISDSILLESYWDDDSYKEGLVIINERNEIQKTWFGQIMNLFVFVMPYYPQVGLYGYKIIDDKILFYKTKDNHPIYADDSFIIKNDVDAIIACNQPRYKNQYGGEYWWIYPSKNYFYKKKSIMKGLFITLDSTLFYKEMNDFFKQIDSSCKNNTIETSPLPNGTLDCFNMKAQDATAINKQLKKSL